jgi:exosortase/archaeosortase family protein
MLVVFFALSTAVAMLIRKPMWEKILIAASAIPIALVSNILRIVVTGLFYDAFGSNFGGAFFHDLAGWLMMPLGLVFLGVELWILKRLLIERATAPITGKVQSQRVEVPAIALYDGGTKPRRAKFEPEPVETNA